MAARKMSSVWAAWFVCQAIVWPSGEMAGPLVSMVAVGKGGVGALSVAVEADDPDFRPLLAVCAVALGLEQDGALEADAGA